MLDSIDAASTSTPCQSTGLVRSNLLPLHSGDSTRDDAATVCFLEPKVDSRLDLDFQALIAHLKKDGEEPGHREPSEGVTEPSRGVATGSLADADASWPTCRARSFGRRRGAGPDQQRRSDRSQRAWTRQSTTY